MHSSTDEHEATIDFYPKGKDKTFWIWYNFDDILLREDTSASPRDPRIAHWADMMKRLGGSEVPRTTWDDEFFLWWGEQIIAVDDYPYAGMDFRGDPDLVLPPGTAWGTVGKFAKFFDLYNFFWIFSNMYEKMKNKHVFDWIHND